ncbi:hypothetical protein A2617_03865 [Candidatus Daviesbacteria bacterium RIFOXYD1_FULL_41_10]|uniref:Uncharacterized protein n=2 Tax=Candidatus Daviesiibacteriota TaxID=1752718 RepID=A0A1F5N018_9BACT|nr:MAG: hypothetical protein UU67_C0003G0025 [Candidatus Daviesbacteria bacterium GW2011_GWB1_41_5]OGE70954.1 MAG: hypothetical protein A2617_03865 [Candidatus Daviesbacteria bacterium RIFOXYD1_FULL_41_10]
MLERLNQILHRSKNRPETPLVVEKTPVRKPVIPWGKTPKERLEAAFAIPGFAKGIRTYEQTPYGVIEIDWDMTNGFKNGMERFTRGVTFYQGETEASLKEKGRTNLG